MHALCVCVRNKQAIVVLAMERNACVPATHSRATRMHACTHASRFLVRLCFGGRVAPEEQEIDGLIDSFIHSCRFDTMIIDSIRFESSSPGRGMCVCEVLFWALQTS
mmetsp:Transcript_21986/g.47834  ORF Transcript_21986/g.47834 Transcript_21986/m.47834 type:complete len:107 (+) Transcript_21986:135-455(+)